MAIIETRAIHGDGQQVIHRFTNDYGASVVRHEFSYGNEDGLWELAVIKFTESGWNIVYDTTITDDVLGRLSDEEVEEALKAIEAL